MEYNTLISKLATGLMIGMLTLSVFAENKSEDSQESRSEKFNDLTDEQRESREKMHEKNKDMTVPRQRHVDQIV